ncbi:MAG: hypothetical protein ABJF01_06500 [bacterium]
MSRWLAAIALALVAACGGAPVGASLPAQVPPRIPSTRVTQDSTSAALVPAGFGTLKQEDIAITLQPNGVRVTAIPLDESVIRVLAPDAYRSLHSILESKRQQILQRAASHNTRDPRVWYVTFTGLVPDARFVPTDITVTSGGRDYRPLDVIGLSSGFAEQRLQPRSTEKGLLIFDEGLDVSQPVVVSIGSERNIDWSNDRSDSILSKIESERAQVRARAGGRP